eukprot:TRINITY_DN477_c0_g1_i1.p1 TRINITY_DN477_c0_g1~~TRINITY_DN477_c0_g1_i1.p1  ORF type:complete len:487 (-),score=98.66 TRINITY_DN477_c0_g1_i1:70-1530(-)
MGSVFSSLASPVVLAIAAIVVILAVVRKMQARKYAGLNLPPQEQGIIPFVGVGLNFASGPLQYATKVYKEKGEIFTLTMFGKRMTFLVGPEAHMPFFSKNDTELSQEEPYKFCVPIFGPNVVYGTDLLHRQQQLKFISASLSGRALASYVPMIVKEAEDFFAKWGDEGEVDIRNELSELIILTASRCLMGREIRENLFTEVAHLYQMLDEGLTPISVFFPYLPIPAHKRRDQARLEMVKLFSKIIDERRKTPEVKHEDCLQVFMDSQYRDKRKLTDEEITGVMIALLFAGQHTSSVTGSWTGLLLLEKENKAKFYDQIMAEQERVLNETDGELTLEALDNMTDLHNCVKEALRMYPPLIFVMRQVTKAFQYKEYDIPENDILFVSPALSHRLDDVYAQADTYNPNRWRDNPPTRKYSWLGFGDGRHACMGENFAYVQLKTLWSVLLRNFELDLVGALPEPDYKAMVVGPQHPCKLRYKRRNSGGCC